MDDEGQTKFPEHCSHRHLGIEVVGDTNVLVCQRCLAVVDRDLPVYFKN